MILLHSLPTDIYRDGGSYGARFSARDGQTPPCCLTRDVTKLAHPDRVAVTIVLLGEPVLLRSPDHNLSSATLLLQLCSGSKSTPLRWSEM
jgi:hypothetical protein